jgi:hypothetical protein
MKLRLSDRVERDERVALMLDRHVRGTHGSAPIHTARQQHLQRRLALALARA